MDTLSFILFKMVFQDGCVEKRKRGSWVGRMGCTKTWYIKGKVWLYLDKSNKRVKCIKVNKERSG